jgi:quinol monooxygenase YgiN
LTLSYVAFALECNIVDRTALEAVMTDLATSAESDEPGTLIYEWSVSEDGSKLTTYERFADADAALTHLGGFGPHAERFMAAVTPTRVTVFGSPSAALKEALAAFAPTYFSQIGGFHR